MNRSRFSGAIAGVGSSSGVRVVVGRWHDSPFGAFADVMLAEPDGTRVLLAPDEQVADFVSATYRFDRVEIGAVSVTGDWQVKAPGSGAADRGREAGIARSVAATGPVPAGHGTRLDAGDRPGVQSRAQRRTHSGDGGQRTPGVLRRDRPAPGHLDHRTWQGVDLGALAPVWPEPGFGFGSTPRTPSVTTVVTTVEVG